MIKQEPPFMINSPDDLNNNTNRVNTIVSSQENCLSNMISDGSNFNATPQITTNTTNAQDQDIKPSVLSMTANSRLLNNLENNGFNSNMNHYVKQELMSNDNNTRLVQNNMSGQSTLSDIDLDEFPDNIMDDMDISVFNLNDQDFTSIKSIVEQTFKDGRDVLDIISTV